MVELLLIRHGETDWNLQGRMQGQTDIPLNQTGMRQAELLAEQLSVRHIPIHALYSSDLVRAHTTAQFTADKLQLPITLSSNFREIHYGKAEGLIAHDALEKNMTGAESHENVLQRAKHEILTIAPRHQNEKIAIFTHGRVMHILIEHASGKKSISNIRNCTVARFRYNFSTQILDFIEIEYLL